MAFLFLVIAAAISGISCDEMSDAASYLQHFGYYNPNAYDGSSNLENAIRTYQWFYQLNETGVLDQETKDMMSKPRCGFPDITHNYGYYSTRRRWRSNTVNYAYDNYGDERELNRQAKKNAVVKALNLWAGVANLNFKEVGSRRGNINIGWYSGYHGDNGPFNGPWGVLAHAYFPPNGNTHFDEAERWTVNSAGGVDMVELAAHEIGHALGLDHSRVRGTVMWPSYIRYRPNLQLHSDDVAGIRKLYGSGVGTVNGIKAGTGTGTGTGTGGGNCSDSHSRCSYWASIGECYKNPRWMLPNCKKSCKRC